jgi:hypothetical protein
MDSIVVRREAAHLCIRQQIEKFPIAIRQDKLTLMKRKDPMIADPTITARWK